MSGSRRLLSTLLGALLLLGACGDAAAPGAHGARDGSLAPQTAEAGSDAGPPEWDAATAPVEGSAPTLMGEVQDALTLRFSARGLVAQGTNVLVVGSNGRPAVARFTASGQLDESFGVDGVASIPQQPNDVPEGSYFVSVGEEANTVLVTDDALFVGGQVNGNQGGGALVVAKFTSDGELVREFATDGVWLHSLGGGKGAVSKLLARPDGGLLVVSYVDVELRFSTDVQWSLVALDPNGVPESALTPEQPPGALGVGGWVADAFLADESLFIAGARYELGKFSLSGAPDPSFGQGGVVGVDYDDTYYWSSAALRRPSGELVIVGGAEGGAQDPAAEEAVHLVQFRPDGSLDDGFGEAGQSILDSGAFGQTPCGAAALADGRILVYQESAAGFTTLLMVEPDGSFDEGFGTGGRLELDAAAHGLPALFSNGVDGRRLLLRDEDVWLAGRKQVRNADGASEYRLWLYRHAL